MAATFSKHKIMDMVNKAVQRARAFPDEREAMYYALYYVACFSITREQFDQLVKSEGNMVGYGPTLRTVTNDTYDAFR